MIASGAIPRAAALVMSSAYMKLAKEIGRSRGKVGYGVRDDLEISKWRGPNGWRIGVTARVWGRNYACTRSVYMDQL